MATLIRRPTGNSSTYNQFISQTGGNKWDDVEEVSADDATSYIQNPNEGGAPDQGFTYSSIAITATSITSVAVSARYRENPSSGTSVFISRFIVVGGTQYQWGADPIEAPTDHSWATDATAVWTTNPATTFAWTEADIEGSSANPLQEFGVTVGNAAGDYLDVTQVFMTVTFDGTEDGVGDPTVGWYTVTG